MALGAVFEGLLCQSQRSYAAGEDGLPGDSALCSIVATEWPDVHARLAAGLSR